MPNTGSDKVAKFAVLSRVAVLTIQVIANAVVPDHDADAFNPPKAPDIAESAADKLVGFLIGGMRRWDGIYFLHIAEHGYTYENTLAFFPLFPVIVRLLASTLGWPLSFVMSYPSCLLLLAVVLNNWLFVKCAVLLFRLGCQVLKDDRLAYKAALLFCINPASVFMSSPYSETLFCYFNLKAWLCLATAKGFTAAFCWGLSGAVRSNGIVGLGFLWFKRISGLVKRVYDLWCTGMETRRDTLVIFSTYCYLYGSSAIFSAILCLLPFCCFQYYAYSRFCFPDDASVLPPHIYKYGLEQNYKMWGPPFSPWCQDTLPLSYEYIQKSHWSLGLFKYYQLKQIPNFILASPIVALGVSSCFHYVVKNLRFCMQLGVELTGGRPSSDERKPADLGDYGLKNRKLFLFMVHLCFLLTFGCLFMHIQVLTRMLASSCPLLYWYAAYLTSADSKPAKLRNPYDLRQSRSADLSVDTPENMRHSYRNALTDQLTGRVPFPSRAGRLVVVYFVAYFVIGTVAFSNFLPWT